MKKVVKKDFNNKKDEYFHKINSLIDGGKYTHSMNEPLNRVHKKLAKEQKKI